MNVMYKHYDMTHPSSVVLPSPPRTCLHGPETSSESECTRTGPPPSAPYGYIAPKCLVSTESRTSDNIC